MKSIITTLLCTAMMLSVGAADAGKKTNPNLDALTVISTVSSVDGAIAGFRCADGSVTGNPGDSCGVESIIYPISGNVYAAMVNPTTGETGGAIKQVGTINATPEFALSFFALGDPDVDWRDLPVLPWTMSAFSMEIGGSTFESIEGMELDGSAFAALGPVENPYTPTGASLRMGGCEGIHEVSGEGDYANMIGTLCLNGTFSFQQNFDGKGVSNCTLVLHDPWM
ncbi:MAG: hypothetical protein JRG79_18330 [Deltaproteobacteria bacterium]|nr:hypothetical protein [Deltaproteobacteria bacterium]